MHRAWIVVVLGVVACDRTPPAAPPAAGSGAGAGSAPSVATSVVTIDAAPPPVVATDAQVAGPPPRAQLELAAGSLEGSRTIAQELTAKDCTPPTKVEIVQSSFQNADMCLLVIRRGAEHVVDTDLQCAKHRVSLAAAACKGDTLEVVLGVELMQAHIACTVATEARCTRNVLPVLFDRDLAAFLETVSRTLASHDKKALLALFAADHKQSQLVDLKQPVDDYLRESFGFRGRDVYERIQRLEATDAVLEHDFYTVTGWVTLEDGKRVRTRFMVVRTKAGFELTGAVG